jgi:hypothetical protein
MTQALTRCRDPEAREECWHVYYGDVRAGVITRSTGRPLDGPQWQWHCGFYPGSNPGETTSGSTVTSDQTRDKHT